MSEEEKNGSSTGETDADKEVAEIVKKSVVEHLVRVIQPEGTGAKTGDNPPSKDPKDGESYDDLMARLQQAEQARAEAEAEVTRITDASKVTADELKQRKGQLEALALKEFEEKKEILVGRVREAQGDEKADEVEEMIKTGQDIDRITRFITIFEDAIKKGPEGDVSARDPEEDGEPKKTPIGKVSGRKVEDPDATSLESGAAWVKQVYDTVEEGMFLRAMSMPYDANKLAQAEMQRNQLLKSFLQGERNREKITKVVVMQCRECGRILTGGETQCPDCEAPVYHRVQGGIR